MGIFRFIGACVVTGVIVSIASLLWPQVTDAPRPEALNNVRSAVVATKTGAHMAEVLGVSDETQIEPLSAQSFVDSAGHAVLGAVQKRVRHVVITHAIRQLMIQFDDLPSEQQELLTAYICATPSATPAEQRENSVEE